MKKSYFQQTLKQNLEKEDKKSHKQTKAFTKFWKNPENVLLTKEKKKLYSLRVIMSPC